MSMLARLVAFGTLATVPVALVPASAAEVNFITDFGYNGRHSYFYVALDKGYYKAEGLEVNILRGQGSADAIKKVASGAAVVGFADAGSLVLARSNDGSRSSCSRSSTRGRHTRSLRWPTAASRRPRIWKAGRWRIRRSARCR